MEMMQVAYLSLAIYASRQRERDIRAVFKCVILYSQCKFGMLMLRYSWTLTKLLKCNTWLDGYLHSKLSWVYVCLVLFFSYLAVTDPPQKSNSIWWENCSIMHQTKTVQIPVGCFLATVHSRVLLPIPVYIHIYTAHVYLKKKKGKTDSYWK